jgi:hypothetical protein
VPALSAWLMLVPQVLPRNGSHGSEKFQRGHFGICSATRGTAHHLMDRLRPQIFRNFLPLLPIPR